MKKSIILIFAVLACALNSFSQSPDWIWAKAIVGISDESGRSVKVDNSGNSYFTGNYSTPTIIIGSDTLVNKGSGDIFIVKYDAMGNVLWAKSAGGSDYDFAECIALDAIGNCYLTGYFRSSSISFDSLTLTNTTDKNYSDLFIAKYDSSGNVIWAKSAQGNSDDNSRSIWVESNGNFYITGSFYSSNIYFDTAHLTNNYSADIFIAKYNASGDAMWVKSAGGNNYDFSNSVSADQNGNCYVTGNFMSSSISFDSLTLTNTTEGDFSDLFIVKYDSSGNALWAKSTQGNADVESRSIWAESNGSFYITGSFYNSSINFDTINLSNHSYNKSDLYIAKYTALGDVVWAKSAGGDGNDNSFNITVDKSGNSYITGGFGSSRISFDHINLINSGEYDDMFITKYNSHGEVDWAKSAGGNGYDSGSSLSIDPDACIIVTGWFYNIITFSPTTLIGNGQYDFFLAKLNASVNEIDDISHKNQFTIFPNPAVDKICIKTNDEDIGKMYTVYDALGKEVKKGKIESEITIFNLSNLIEGIYLIGIGDNLKQKIIIQNLYK
jgi:hypothetical protein